MHEQKGSLSNPIQILVSFSLLLTRSKEINKEMHRFAIHETFQRISHKKTLPIQKKHTKSVSCLSDSSELCRFLGQNLWVSPIPASSVQETVTRPPWCKGLEESGVFLCCEVEKTLCLVKMVHVSRKNNKINCCK